MAVCSLSTNPTTVTSQYTRIIRCSPQYPDHNEYPEQYNEYPTQYTTDTQSDLQSTILVYFKYTTLLHSAELLLV